MLWGTLAVDNPVSCATYPREIPPPFVREIPPRQGPKFALQRTQRILARKIYRKASKIDSGPFLDASRLPNENKGGADAVGSGGQRPQRGSIRRAEGSDRGSGRLPAGDVCARRRRRQAGAP